MKQITLTLSLCAVAGCLVFSGCSKSKDSKATTENNSGTNAPAAAVSDDSAEMKIKWPVGRKYPMRMELAQVITTKVPNVPEPVKSQVNLVQDYDISAIKELDNGGRQLEMEFKDQTLTVSQGGRPVLNFDSTQNAAQDSANPIMPLLRKMVGAHIYYVLDAEGKVEKVEGTEELMTRIGFNRKSQEHAMFKQMFGEDTLRQYGSFGELMPNRSVKVGESWTVKREVPSSIGNLAVSMKFTFKGWEQQGARKCARIETKGEMSSTSSPGGGNSTVKIEDGKLSGTIWFDPEVGMIINDDIHEIMTLKVLAGGQTLSPELDQTIRIAMVDSGSVH